MAPPPPMPQEVARPPPRGVNAAAEPRRDFFRGTKLCRYYLQGSCEQGADCRFAHGTANLNKPPDFTCARLCREMISAGACSRPGCTYAHTRGELRGRKRQLRAAAVQAELMELEGRGSGATTAKGGAVVGIMDKGDVEDEEVVFALVVRKTLLELVPVSPTSRTRRARSLSLGRQPEVAAY